jgi:predicted acylesterase/phospholipase RssA
MDLSVFENKKNAAVYSGGVVKAAAWHLGVSLALDEIGFQFKSNRTRGKQNPLEIGTYVGSSAGALICLYLASGYSPQNIIRSYLDKGDSVLKPIRYKDMLKLKTPSWKNNIFKADHVLQELPKFIQIILNPITKITGFFTTEGLRDYLLDQVAISNNFEEYDADLFIVGTQLDHSRKVIFSKFHYPTPVYDPSVEYYTGVNVTDATAASMSVPPFYAPFPIYNPVTKKTDQYIDGEIRDTLSSHIAFDHGCENIICSWTHTPYHYHEKLGSLINYGLPSICLQSIFLMIQKKILSKRSIYISIHDMYESIHKYLKEENIDSRVIKRVLKIVEDNVDYRPNVKFFDIFPDHNNHKLFFSPNFSLNTDVMAMIVKSGFKKTMSVFKELR